MSEPRVQTRVVSQYGTHLGVRVTLGSRGWWAGCPADEYAAKEPELIRRATALALGSRP